MKINIARAGIQGYGVIIDHVSIDGGLFLHAKQIPYGPFRSVYDADVDSDRLLAAIRAEGFRLWAENGAHEFRPIIFSSQDAAGQIEAEYMSPEHLDQVRDWQIGMLGGDWIDSRNLDCGATGTLWRPKSRSIEIGDGLLNPWACSELLDSQAQFDAELEASAIDLEIVSRTSTGGILDQTEPDIQGERVPGTETFTVLERDEAGMPSVLSIGYRVHAFEGAPEPDHVRNPGATLKHPKTCALPESPKFWPTPKRDPTVVSAFERIALSMAALVEDQQRQYGDSVGKTGAILAILYPDGIQPDQYDRVLLIVRVLDKLSRLATNKTDLGGESSFRDIMGYAMLAVEKGI